MTTLHPSPVALDPYKLEIKTVQASMFKVLVEALKELLIDTSIEFDETGMKIMTVDTSHVVLVHLKLDASKFEVYHCEAPITIGVNMLNFHKLLKTINSNNTLSLFIDRADVNHLGIKIENSEKNTRTVYKLDLIDLDHQKMTAQSLWFSEAMTMHSSDFQKICRDMNNLADYMDIRIVENQLVFSCTGVYCSQETVIRDIRGIKTSASALMPNSDDPASSASSSPAPAPAPVPAPSSSSPHVVQGVFSIKHLVLFTKCTNLCQFVELYLANDKPLVVKYDVSSLGAIRLVLVPHKELLSP